MRDWTQGLPTQEGVYAVCGYGLGDRKATAVVEVRQYDGELYSNLHRENSERDMDDWHPVAEHSDRFFWCRLSELPPPPPAFKAKDFDI